MIVYYRDYLFNIYTNYIKCLNSTLKFHLAEELGAMEVGLGQVDWVPRQEVHLAQLVAALVEVGTDCRARQAGYVMIVECRHGNDQYHLPHGRCNLLVEGLVA